MKNTKLMARLLVLVLSLCMLLSMLAACNTEKEEPTKTGDPATTTGETGPATDIYGKILDELPTTNFDREFTILAVQSQKAHFYLAEEDLEGADNVKKAIYDRNATVEDRMGVTFNWVFEPGQADAAEIASFIQKVETDCKGDGEYDSVIAYNLVP